MPKRKPYDHAINFEEEASLPKPAKLYPLSPKEKTSLDEWITEELRKGYIQKSKSPIAAPVFFVKKKKERWNTQVCAGLLEIKCNNYQKPLSNPSYCRFDQLSKSSKGLY